MTAPDIAVDASGRRRVRNSIRLRVAGFLLAILVVAFGLIVINAWFHYRELQRTLQTDALYLSERASASILRVVDAQVGHLQLISGLGSLATDNDIQCRLELRALLNRLSRYSAVGIADSSGNMFCVQSKTGISGGNVADREWFRDVVEGQELSFETLVGRFSNRPVLVAAMASLLNERAKVVFSSIDLDWLEAILRRESVGTDNMSVLMVDARGQTLVHTGVSKQALDLHRHSPELWAGITGGRTIVQSEDIDGVGRDFYIAPIMLAGEVRFHVVVAVDSNAARMQAFGTVQNLLLPYVILILVVLALGYMVTEQGIVRPVHRIIASVRRYRDGDTASRVGGPYADNEIGELAETLDNLADAVDTRNLQVQRGAQQLEAAVDRMRALIAASPVPIAALSVDWKIRVWNAAAERVFGFKAEEMIGSTPLMVPKDEVEVSKRLIARVYQGETITNIELKRLHKDGRVLIVLASLAPLRDDEGRIDGAVVIFIDETERRSLERQFVQSQKMEALGQLTGGLSHDFNNLLGIIIGNLDFILDGLDADTPLRSFAESALNSALQGAELNKRLLAFARRQPLSPKGVDLKEHMAATIAVLKRTLGERIVVKSAVAADVAAVYVDETQLQSAILNMGLNARDAMPDGGILSIAVDSRIFDRGSVHASKFELPPGPYVVISISDTGNGMPEDVAKRVFEPFFTTKEVGKGTGLGLSMVHGFAKQSGGHISCYSEPGRGTTFRLYLPAHDGDGKDDVSSSETGVLMVQKIRVVLVEDNADLRVVAHQQLVMFGCDVVEFDNGAAALEYLSGDREVDLMLSDIVMPGMTGRELADRVSVLRPQLKIILMSGYSDPRPLAGASELAEEKWPRLTKPFRRHELYEEIVRQLPWAKR